VHSINQHPGQGTRNHTHSHHGQAIQGCLSQEQKCSISHGTGQHRYYGPETGCAFGVLCNHNYGTTASWQRAQQCSHANFGSGMTGQETADRMFTDPAG
tara:strand:+ start:2169 stop:2465 length:297 start_codon:yes stop_codon:yes gene_type:complete